MLGLISDPTFKTDKARGQVLAGILGISEGSARVKISRFQQSLSRNHLDLSQRVVRHSRPLAWGSGSAPVSPVIPPPAKGEYWVYCVECLDPLCFYVGQSGNLQGRVASHIEKEVPFTKEHGIRHIYLVANTPNYPSSLRLELLLYLVLQKKGLIVGGNEYKEIHGLMSSYTQTIL